MKKILNFGIIVTGLFLASCAADSKDDPNSPSPSIDNRDKFVAYWNVSENSAVVGGTTSHTVNISKSTSLSSDIIISNFYGLSSSVRATVNNNSFTIPPQTVSGGTIKGGSGILSTSTIINLTYTTAIGTVRDSCTAVYSKQ